MEQTFDFKIDSTRLCFYTLVVIVNFVIGGLICKDFFYIYCLFK